jgi:DNA mismatch repair protein MLH1
MSFDLMDLFRNHAYVGVIDPSHSVIISSGCLYVVNHIVVSRVFAYQYVLRNVGKFETFVLPNPVSVLQALIYGLLSPREGYNAEEDGPVEECAKFVVLELQKIADFFYENFGILFKMVNDEFCLLGLPKHPFVSELVQKSVFLPSLLIAFAYDVDYTQDDAAILQQICHVLASKFYVFDHTYFGPKFAISQAENEEDDSKGKKKFVSRDFLSI